MKNIIKVLGPLDFFFLRPSADENADKSDDDMMLKVMMLMVMMT